MPGQMTSLTRNLPWFISEPATSLIGQKCYTSLVERLDFGDTACIKLSLSKGLGLAIVVGGSVVKVPQVLLILSSGSARGLSLPAFTLETLGYAFSLTYSARNDFPFSTYGENLFLTIQNIIVTLLIVYHSPTTSGAKNTFGALIASVLTAIVSALLLIVPQTLLLLLQLSTFPISLFSKIPQIASNARARSTGNLSAIAVVAQIAGCAARLFTTSTELEGDAFVLWGFVLALILNGVIGLQMWMYWGKDIDEKKRESVALAPAEYPWEKLDSRPVSQTQDPSPALQNRAGSVPLPSSSAAGSRRWTRKID